MASYHACSGETHTASIPLPSVPWKFPRPKSSILDATKTAVVVAQRAMSPLPTQVGETSLAKLLASLKLVLEPSTYVFVTLPPNDPVPSSLPLQMLFREREGTTVITTKDAAEATGLQYTFPCRMITLDVHSSLEAVGFLAVIATELKQINMGVNPVSGYYHDHCFVPVGREQEAIQCLEALAKRSREGAEERPA